MPLHLPRSPPSLSPPSFSSQPSLYTPLPSSPSSLSPPPPTSPSSSSSKPHRAPLPPVSLRLRSPRATTLLVTFAAAVVVVSLCLLWVPEHHGSAATMVGKMELASLGTGATQLEGGEMEVGVGGVEFDNALVEADGEGEEVADIWLPADTNSEASSSPSSPSIDSSPLPSSLPPCPPRTLLFRPRSTRGFASEYLRFVRVAAVGREWGYEVVVEDDEVGGRGPGGGGGKERWMYGAFSDYFSPHPRPPPSCALPSYTPRAEIAPDPLSPSSLPLSDSALENEYAAPDSTTARAGLREGEQGEEQGQGEGEGEGRDWRTDPPKWTEEAHVRDGADNAYLSTLFLALSLTSPSTSSTSSLSSLAALHRNELLSYPPALPLASNSTVPPELAAAYAMQEEVVRGEGWWTLEEDIERQVQKLGEWVGGREVVGVHLRLGDKCLESASPKYSPLRFASPSQLAALGVSGRGNACKAKGNRTDVAGEGELAQEEADVYGRAVARSLLALSSTASSADGDDSGDASHVPPPPLVVVMSDSPTALFSLRSAWARSSDGEVQGLVAREAASRASSASVEGAAEGEGEGADGGKFEMVQLKTVAEELGLEFELEGMPASEGGKGGEEEQAEKEAGEGEGAKRMVKRLRSGFSATGFRDSPLPLRIALTRAFIRDLTFLARFSSSLVLTESSNVGRLLTLLAGREMVDAGKVISADVRWFPNAYYD
ncbi:hypothetical protein JCM6882_007560 [Rhodosporidiobolus microsporus]